MHPEDQSEGQGGQHIIHVGESTEHTAVQAYTALVDMVKDQVNRWSKIRPTKDNLSHLFPQEVQGGLGGHLHEIQHAAAVGLRICRDFSALGRTS